jgi:hypothetical protein
MNIYNRLDTRWGLCYYFKVAHNSLVIYVITDVFSPFSR